MMAEPPKKSITRPYFIGDSTNFPTFKVNVPAPTKTAKPSPPKSQAPAPGGKPKG